MTSTISREEVLEIEQKLFDAQLSSDVEILEQLLHVDLIALSPTGEAVTREMDLHPYRTHSVKIDEASTRIDELTIIDDTAITIVSMKAKGKMVDTPIEGQFKYLRVWKKINTEIKLIAASFLPPSLR